LLSAACSLLCSQFSALSSLLSALCSPDHISLLFHHARLYFPSPCLLDLTHFHQD
jgi:hypothetical protein